MTFLGAFVVNGMQGFGLNRLEDEGMLAETIRIVFVLPAEASMFVRCTSAQAV